jgi:hypothetical protein
MAPPELSLVFPVFDEEDNIGPLLESAVALGRRLGRSFEIQLRQPKTVDHIRVVLAPNTTVASGLTQLLLSFSDGPDQLIALTQAQQVELLQIQIQQRDVEIPRIHQLADDAMNGGK